ncbi:MAG: SRPBCC domain-containing protein [Calditrichia bacterium]
MDKIIVQTAVLACRPEKAFQLFTDNGHLENWLTAKAEVEPRTGGKYELFWEPDDPDNNSTIGCRILAVERPHFLNFEWKGPKQFKDFMNTARPLTNVTVLFIPQEAGTMVTLIQTGWREAGDWEKARQYFVNAWKGAFSQLEKYADGMQD